MCHPVMSFPTRVVSIKSLARSIRASSIQVSNSSLVSQLDCRPSPRARARLPPVSRSCVMFRSTLAELDIFMYVRWNIAKILGPFLSFTKLVYLFHSVPSLPLVYLWPNCVHVWATAPWRTYSSWGPILSVKSVSWGKLDKFKEYENDYVCLRDVRIYVIISGE